MTRSFALFTLLLTLAWLGLGVSSQPPARGLPEWTEPDAEAKVWTRWWWHGSAVTPAGITSELEALSDAGFGGVELTPIFGVIGAENDFVDYLSPAWMDLLEHTLREAERLGLQVDMATGTGWPFGGPWVSRDNASKYLAHQTYSLSGGERLRERIAYRQEPLLRRIENVPLMLYRAAESSGTSWAEMDAEAVKEGTADVVVDDLNPVIAENPDLQYLALDQVRFGQDLPLVSLMAYGPRQQRVDLTREVAADGRLNWAAPPGDWKLYALFEGQHGKMVERAAPGGEGYVIDHFSTTAIGDYLDRFDTAFAGRDIGPIRAFFNDSYEVDDARGQANWTPALLTAFADQHGYDLREQLPALFGHATEAENARVLSDYRETVSRLLLETFTQHWDRWAAEHGGQVRNQAHGSPANILDLYAASDIPETEGTQSLRIKMASSAAHVTGKKLVSAEAATWLGEHFVSDLADLKANLDQYLVNGVNHLVYHGTAYSPADGPWPGRLFYAAFHANDRNPMWEDLKALNRYVGRTQSFLQRSSPDNDVLLYFPAYDRFATRGVELLQHFDGHGPSLDTTAVAELGEQLLQSGYAFDFVSDQQLQATHYDGAIQTGGSGYQTVLVPFTRYMPLATFEALMKLAQAGATVVFQEQLPESIPGMGNWEVRDQQLQTLKSRLSFTPAQAGRNAKVGEGRFIVASGWEQALQELALRREAMVEHGLSFTRRRFAGGTLYFIANQTEAAVDGWVPLAARGAGAALLDPMTGERGLGQISPESNAGGLSVRLQIPAGGTVLAWVSPEPLEGAAWPYFTPGGAAVALGGTWKLDFVTGGPELPKAVELSQAKLWTELSGEAYASFAGTGRYSLAFDRPAGTAADAYQLDLGEVHETARVSLNGALLATLIGPSYQVRIPADRLQDKNILEVEVSNRMVNRIIHLDRNQVFWKKFYNVNFPSRLRDNTGPLGIFDASEWAPVPSGLAGPVTLTPGRTTGTP